MLRRRNICHNKLQKQEWNIVLCYHFLLTTPQTGKADDKDQQYTGPLLLIFLYSNKYHTNGRKLCFQLSRIQIHFNATFSTDVFRFLRIWTPYKRLRHVLNSIRKPIVRERNEVVSSRKRNAILIEHALQAYKCHSLSYVGSKFLWSPIQSLRDWWRHVERQGTYNVTLRRVRASIFVLEKQ